MHRIFLDMIKQLHMTELACITSYHLPAELSDWMHAPCPL